LRRRAIFGEVREGFCKQEPSLAAALDGISTSLVFVVPLFASEGYFTDRVIPEKLGFPKRAQTRFPRIRRRRGQTLVYCGPVGTHPSMADVIVDQACAVTRRPAVPPPPELKETALIIAGHGTLRHEKSRAAIEEAARLIRNQSRFAEVHAAVLEEEPRLADCYQIARSHSLVIVPFFMSDGLHAREDIPVLLGEPEEWVQERMSCGQPSWRNPTERHGKRVWYAASVGTAPGIADVILERARQGLSAALNLQNSSSQSS
jgi:sirohydrochlorin cobaltochelatase